MRNERANCFARVGNRTPEHVSRLRETARRAQRYLRDEWLLPRSELVTVGRFPHSALPKRTAPTGAGFALSTCGMSEQTALLASGIGPITTFAVAKVVINAQRHPSPLS